MTDVSRLQDAEKALAGLDGVEEITKQIEALRVELLEKSKEGFKLACKDIFERFPTLESFAWEQYTPYFNDGEACEFNVYADYGLELNGVNPDNCEVDVLSETLSEYGYVEVGGRRSYTKIKEWPNPDYDPALSGAEKLIQKFIAALPEDTLKSMFGDHAKVIVSKDKVEVAAVDHE